MTWTASSKPCTEIRIVRTLLASIVDYAGLFPPARLDVEAAAAAFDRYRSGAHGWMLGAFVTPFGRVGELATQVERRAPSTPWRLSVVVDSIEQGARVVEDVERRYSRSLSLAGIEVRPRHAGEIVSGQAVAETLRDGVDIFYEVRSDADMPGCLDAVAAVGGQAKVRTGGVAVDAFPTRTEVARFVCACEERGLAFKATAGLHHPFPGCYALTYEPHSGCGRMHGFLGLALVAALVHEHRLNVDTAVRLLGGGVDSLDLGESAVHWHGFSLEEEELARSRREFFRGFGSCSFEEPVSELQAAGVL